VQDVKTCDYASQVPDKMHACGHDAHVTMALGAATILASMRDSLEGEVVFLFQPAEEGPGGALPMIEEGALQGVDFIVGQHMGPLHPTGDIAVSDGPAMAAADFFELTIVGRGGHGAYPHLSIDAIPIAAQVVTALQTIVSRGIDPLKSAVVSIGTIEGGYRSNVVADKVKMTGTTRSFDPGVRLAIRDRVEAIVAGVVGAHGGSYELHYRLGYPPLLNHKGALTVLRRVAADLLGAEHVHTVPPSMGGEDFAYFLQKIPGCFYWLGCRGGAPRPNIHHPAFDLDEEALVTGVQLFVHVALEFLSFGPLASQELPLSD
jgi:amidohydrolase